MNRYEAFFAAHALVAEAERRYELAVGHAVRARNAALEAQADYFRVLDLAGECAARLAEAESEPTCAFPTSHLPNRNEDAA